MGRGYRRNDAGFRTTTECVLEEKCEFGFAGLDNAPVTVFIITDLERAGWISLLISVQEAAGWRVAIVVVCKWSTKARIGFFAAEDTGLGEGWSLSSSTFKLSEMHSQVKAVSSSTLSPVDDKLEIEEY
jgi:hypothetical protein